MLAMTIDHLSGAVPVIDPEVREVQIVHVGDLPVPDGNKPDFVPLYVSFYAVPSGHDFTDLAPVPGGAGLVGVLHDRLRCVWAADVFRYSRGKNPEGLYRMEVQRAVNIAIEDGAITALDGEVLCACLGPAATLGELRPHLRSMIAARKAEALGLVVVGGAHIDTDGIRRAPASLRIVSTEAKKKDASEDRKRQTVLLSVARLPDAGVSPLWAWLHARGWLE